MDITNKQTNNPLRGEHVLLSFKMKHFLDYDKAFVNFSYIPDREILTEEIFSAWLKAVQNKQKDQTPETIAKTLTHEFYHEVLPFYAAIHIKIHHKSGAIQHIQIIKKQPNYKIPAELQDTIHSHL